jgi:hypothetical protein
VGPVPDPLLLRYLAALGIEPGTSRSAARNSDHETTAAVNEYQKQKKLSWEQRATGA